MEKQVSGASSLRRRSKAGPRTREKTMRGHAGFRRWDIGARPRRRVVSWCHEGLRSHQEAGWRGGLKACSPE